MNYAEILIVDDESSFLRSMRRILWQEGYANVTLEEKSENLIPLLQKKEFDLILLDVNMPVIDGITLLEKISQNFPLIPVIMISANNSYSMAFNAIQLGAYDFITKPPEPERLFISIRRALESKLNLIERESLRIQSYHQVKSRKSFEDIISKSPKMEKVFSLVEIFAPTNETVLITGETGTGKDLIARKIHDLSPRKNEPFVVVNIVSISESLFESELFGYEKGAFTGADRIKTGYFETAAGGTIFLDEIGDLSNEMQAKLLRTIQYGEIYRIGNPKPIKLNSRIIAATNKNLLAAIEKGTFRADLFYRLNRGYIEIPPLRERKEDIIPLAKKFLEDGNETYNRAIKGFSNEVLERLINYDYPGNIRELENIILNAVAKNKDSELISAIDIKTKPGAISESKVTQKKISSLEEMIDSYIQLVLNEMEGNTTKASAALGISERTLQRKLKKIRDQNK
ncbi:MAG: sigma-54-dependent Fis family transcriptional regulator [Ignavibacteriaceae bacterium]|nr:sigma-54-dependent Fis family transcriptional regulator [Ignavibacteriaceae bacterium]